jgi:hypothetical protein
LLHPNPAEINIPAILTLLAFWKNLLGKQVYRQSPHPALLPGGFLTEDSIRKIKRDCLSCMMQMSWFADKGFVWPGDKKSHV